MKLQIIYFTIDIPLSSLGVYNKIRSKVSIFQKNNCECEWINIHTKEKKIFLNNSFAYHYLNDDSLLKYLDQFNSHIFIFRHHEFNETIFKVIKKHNTISEHNTIEIDEWVGIYKDYTIKDWFYLIRTLEIKYVIRKLYFYKYLAKNWYKDFKGFVAVTDEIKKFQIKNYYSSNTHHKTISNGVKLRENIELNQFLYDSTQKTIFVFFAGGDYLWNNFNRFYKSIKNTSLENYNIIYYGQIKEEDKIVDKCLEYKNQYNENDLLNLLKNNVIGIGTLGLYRKGLFEACPLKVRDYWSLGLPVILGYKDTDVINNPAFSKFVLEVSNDDSIISSEKITEFIKSLKGFKREDIINEAVKISLDEKIKSYIQFLNEINIDS